MRIHVEQRLPAPPDDVQAALIDPAYLARLAELPKLGTPELLAQDRADGIVRQRARYQFAGELNAAVRRVVEPRRLTWVEVVTVDLERRHTDWHIEPDHYGSLLRASGTVRLEDGSGGQGKSTRRIADLDLRVNFPVVGGKVERAIASGLEEHAALEEDALVAWLQEGH